MKIITTLRMSLGDVLFQARVKNGKAGANVGSRNDLEVKTNLLTETEMEIKKMFKGSGYENR